MLKPKVPLSSTSQIQSITSFPVEKYRIFTEIHTFKYEILLTLFLVVIQIFFKKRGAMPIQMHTHTVQQIHSTADTRWLLDLVHTLQEMVWNVLMSFYRIPSSSSFAVIAFKNRIPEKNKSDVPRLSGGNCLDYNHQRSLQADWRNRWPAVV